MSLCPVLFFPAQLLFCQSSVVIRSQVLMSQLHIPQIVWKDSSYPHRHSICHPIDDLSVITCFTRQNMLSFFFCFRLERVVIALGVLYWSVFTIL